MMDVMEPKTVKTRTFDDVVVRFHDCQPFSVGMEGVLHKLSTVYKILYVSAGSSTMRFQSCADTETEEYRLKAGEFIYLPPGTYYSNINNDKNGVFDGVNLSFVIEPNGSDASLSASAEHYAQEYVLPCFSEIETVRRTRPFAPLVPLADAPLLSCPFCRKDTFGVKAALDRLTVEMIRRHRFSRKVCDALMTELLVSIVIAGEDGGFSGGTRPAERAILYICEHYQEKLTCETVGRALGYHPNYLNTLFRRVTGMTLHRCIIDTKLQRAQMLVRNTDMPIAEIAAMLSFSDAAAFTKLFAGKYGLSPLKYRQMKK